MTRLSKLMLPTLALSVASLLSSNLVSASDKCYVLALSSGQENAAYQAGVLNGLLSKLPADQLRYQAVTGVAGGAVNAVYLGQTAVGSEQDAVTKMTSFWRDAASTKLYQNWWGGVVAGLFTAGGIYDDAPLYDFLKKRFLNHETFQRDVAVGIVDVLEGDYRNYFSKDL